MGHQHRDDLEELTAPTLKKKAINAFNLGIEYLARGGKLEEEAAATDGSRAAGKAAKAQTCYRKAIRHFRKAIDEESAFCQALGGLGLALLKTEQYAEALEAYDRAMALGPVYPEVIEERGEVYLGLDRIAEAQEAYLQLVPVDGDGAADLMTAMRHWLKIRREDAGGFSEETLESFAAWIEENEVPETSEATSPQPSEG